MVTRKSLTTGVYLYLMFSCLDMKRTTESKTESKLDTGLEPGGDLFSVSGHSVFGLLIFYYEKVSRDLGSGFKILFVALERLCQNTL